MAADMAVYQTAAGLGGLAEIDGWSPSIERGPGFNNPGSKWTFACESQACRPLNWEKTGASLDHARRTHRLSHDLARGTAHGEPVGLTHGSRASTPVLACMRARQRAGTAVCVHVGARTRGGTHQRAVRARSLVRPTAGPSTRVRARMREAGPLGHAPAYRPSRGRSTAPLDPVRRFPPAGHQTTLACRHDT